MASKAVEKKKTSCSKSEIETEVVAIIDECLSRKGLEKLESVKLLLSLKFHLMKKKLIKSAIFVLLMLLIIFLVLNSEIVQWNLSAVGRILLSKLSLYWNWEKYHNARCLIEKTTDKAPTGSTKDNFLTTDDCVVCENLNGIQYVENLNFTSFNDNYLLRGIPVVVIDSHEPYPDCTNFGSFLQNLPGFSTSNPCNLQTNLVLTRDIKFSKILKVVEKKHSTLNKDGWFIHFRNCEFEAVKGSRGISQKPYFYPSHLEQPHTTWILMSKNYGAKYYKSLKLIDLVVVQQLKGKLEVILEGKDDCFDYCGRHSVTIFEGQSLAFLSKLWTFKYLPTDGEISISLITETYFD